MSRVTSTGIGADLARVAGWRWYLTAGLLFTAIAIYGSLVPLTYQPRPWDEALAAFAQIRYLQLGVDSRADFVANILLFIPLGFCFMGALRVDRRGRAAAVAAGIGVALSCAALSTAIEFTQVFFPPRTVSINDIVAETTGASIGIIAWALGGGALTGWTRRFFACRERSGLAIHFLMLYAALFAASEMLPLDITISLHELADKYRQGRVVLLPFSHAFDSPMLAVWEIAADVLLHVPIGALALVGWTRAGRWRRRSDAFALGGIYVAAIEAAQLFVFTRFSDVTDLFVGAAGVALGIALTPIVAAPPDRAEADGASLIPRCAWAGTIGWVGVLTAYHWYPFDFAMDGALLSQGTTQMFAAPFTHYYWGTEFQAFTQISRKLLMAAPLGVLMRLGLPEDTRAAAGRLATATVFVLAFLVLFGIEAGQMLLPERIPDITDVMIAQAGVMMGFALASILSATSSPRQVEPASW